MTSHTSSHSNPAPHEGRLERIEEKLDKLADAIVSLARVEEKIVSLEDKVVQAVTTTNNLTREMAQTKMDCISCQNGIRLNANALANLHKFFWITFSALLGSASLVWFTILWDHKSSSGGH